MAARPDPVSHPEVAVRIISRHEWGAKPPARPLIAAQLPWPRLWLHHTVTRQGGADVMRDVQRDHQGRGWRDFAYNFGIDRDGRVYEGIGLFRHLNSDASMSGTIVLLGNYETHRPTEAMLDATAWLVAHGVLSGWWSDEMRDAPHVTGGHRDIRTMVDPKAKATACPGRYAHAALPSINARARAIIYDLRKEDDDMAINVGRSSSGQWYRFDGAKAIPITAKASERLRFLTAGEIPTSLVDMELDAVDGSCVVTPR